MFCCNLLPTGYDLKDFGFEIIQARILSHYTRQSVNNTDLIDSCKLVHLQITMTKQLLTFTVQR